MNRLHEKDYKLSNQLDTITFLYYYKHKYIYNKIKKKKLFQFFERRFSPMVFSFVYSIHSSVIRISLSLRNLDSVGIGDPAESQSTTSQSQAVRRASLVTPLPPELYSATAYWFRPNHPSRWSKTNDEDNTDLNHEPHNQHRNWNAIGFCEPCRWEKCRAMGVTQQWSFVSFN